MNMQKAFVIIDMPNCCSNCCFSEAFAGNYICSICHQAIPSLTAQLQRLDECPLRPIPEKHTPKNAVLLDSSWAKGWNECVDFILGKGNMKK